MATSIQHQYQSIRKIKRIVSKTRHIIILKIKECAMCLTYTTQCDRVNQNEHSFCSILGYDKFIHTTICVALDRCPTPVFITIDNMRGETMIEYNDILWHETTYTIMHENNFVSIMLYRLLTSLFMHVYEEPFLTF